MSIDTSTTDTGLIVKTTKPDQLLRHDISDEELEALCQMNSSHLVEAMWVALGAFIGFLPTAFGAVEKAYYVNPTAPISGVDFIQVILCGISIAVFITIGLMVKGQKDSTQVLQNAIRKRGNI